MLALRALAPLQLLPKHGKVAVARRVQETDRILGAMQADRIIFRQINGHLAIKVHPAIGGVGNAQLDFRLIANQNRAVGQCMRTQGNERNSGNLRVQDRAIGRQCIGRGTRGCGNDQPVGTQVVDEFAIDEQFELDHATDGPLVDHDIVQGQIGSQLLAIAHDFGVKQHAGLGNEAAVEQVFHAGQHVGARDVGHEAEPPLVYPDQRHTVAGQPPRRIEHGAVTTEHNRQIDTGTDGFEAAADPAVASGVTPHIGRSFFLYHYRHASFLKIFGKRTKRLGDLGALVAADQCDGPWRSGGAGV